MICVSLASMTFDECFKAIKKAEFAELRLDLLDLTDEQLKTLLSIKSKTIVTCRPGKYSETERVNLLKRVIDYGAGYLDIEYEANEKYREELVKYAHSKNKLVIISYHNWETTPSKKDLDKIIKKSRKWKADRVKIATTAISKVDAIRIMSLYEEYTNIIAFCMGKMGMITRIAAPILGSDFTFAAINSKLATAPGQLTVEELMEIYEYMDVDY
jgi:3-dehydroquinate dehydratase I